MTHQNQQRLGKTLWASAEQGRGAISAILEKHKARIKSDQVFFVPDIPSRKLQNAIRAYAPGIAEEDALVLVDNTAWGGARHGLLLTGDVFFICNSEEKFRIGFDEIEKVAFNEAWPSSFLQVNHIRFAWDSALDKTVMYRIAQMLREIAATHERKTRAPMTVVEIVNAHASIVNGGKIYFAPHIPRRKLQNAIQTYAPAVHADEALALLDTTIFGSSKEGGLLTKDAFYVRDMGEDPRSIALKKVEAVEYEEKPGVLLVNGRNFMRNYGGLPEPWRRFTQMLREIGAASRPAPETAAPHTPSESGVDAPDGIEAAEDLSSGNVAVRGNARETIEAYGASGFAGGLALSGAAAGAVVAPDLRRIEVFLRESLRGRYNAHFAPDILPEKENNARAACKTPDNDKMLALVTATDSGKRGVAFTNAGIYVKKMFSEPMAIPYAALPGRTYESLRADMDGIGALIGDEMAVIAQKLKNIVMFGAADARELPHDPAKDPHPVKNWFKSAGGFIVFVILIPWLLFEGFDKKTGYPGLRGWLGLVSMLSFFTWFNSHRVTARKADKHAFSTIIKRVVIGLLASAAFVGAVLLDKYDDPPRGGPFFPVVGLVAAALAGVAVCMILFFKAQKYFHKKRMAAAVEHVANRYLENEHATGATGLVGLMEAGVRELDSDADVRAACRLIREHAADPLDKYRDLLADVDLADFFEFAAARGYDFVRHGDPGEIAREVSRHGG